MSQKDTKTKDELSTAEIAGMAFAKLVLIPVTVLGIIALVTINLGETFASIPKFSNSEVTDFISTFPEPIHIGIAGGCAILLLYGHFLTDHPVLGIAMGKYRYPEESPKEDLAEDD